MTGPATSPDVAAEISRWLGYLGAERRMSEKTLEAYGRDVSQFLGFLAEHMGGPPSLRQLAKLTPADVRAFMAARRGGGAGSRTLMRGLAGARSFARFLERNGKGKVGALAAVRAPKLPRSLPKPLAIKDAKRMTDTDRRDAKRARALDQRRDAAVPGLLYGSGLRIAEALSLARKEAPVPASATNSPSPAKATRRAWCRCRHRSGKLIADYVALCPLDLHRRTARCSRAR